MRLKAVAIVLSATALVGCATSGSQNHNNFDGDQPPKATLSQNESYEEAKPEEAITVAIKEEQLLTEVPIEALASSLASQEQALDTVKPSSDDLKSEHVDESEMAKQKELVTVDVPETPRPKLIVYKWYEGETLRQALERWISDAEYKKLVWHVLDDEGDTVEIPIATNHTFDSKFEEILPIVKRAYATSPINPLHLDFTIKKGNKTLIVTNAGSAQ